MQMSPLPETDLSHITYTSMQENIKSFFEREIPDNNSWKWHVNLDNNNKTKELFDRMNVNLEAPLERYSTTDEQGEQYHNIYSTNMNGTYIELVFANFESSRGNSRSILKNSKHTIVHRLGNNENEEYLASITTS